MAGRVLIVDDDREMCDALMAELPSKGYSGCARTSADEAFRLLETEEFDVVVTDINLGGSNGIELCAKIAANRPDTPVVVITAFGSMQAAIEAIRAGAYDFVTKPFDMPTLALALNRAVQHRTLRNEVRRLQQEVDTTRMIGQVTGESAAMKPVRQLIERLADSDASVLITGESGTGKERVARALHRTGRRRDAPMIPINCAALPESLLESELFGHVKGAFTDARTPHAGLFVQAHGGTLFLDEIGDMPLPLQAKLLRAIQERRVRPVGGTSETPFDVRLVTATNRNLELAVEAKTFREDLFFRVNVVQIDLPPLRARGNDILVLAQHFIQSFAEQAGRPIRGLSPGTAEKLLAYSWPGNVRELRNHMERAVALTQFEEVTIEDLPAKVRSYRRSDLLLLEGLDPAELPALEEMERRYVLRVMESVGGNRGQAARILDLDRKTLYRRLDRYGYKDAADA
jgi:DNA-binding NtrC family response regulator